MNHSFNILFAQKYGLDEAVFIQNLIFWTSSNAAHGEENNIHFQDGRYWSFGTPEYFCKFFIYWKPRRIKDIINSCLKQDLIIKNVFNKKGYDRTNWYSLSDNALLELNLDKTCLKPSPVLIRRNPSNALDEIRLMDRTDSVQPIPYTKPYTKPNINNKGVSAETLNDENNSEKIFGDNNIEKIDGDNNQTLIAIETKKGLDVTGSELKSDYQKNQTLNCTVTSRITHYDIKNILSDNIFQIPEQIIHDWIANRKKKRAAVTQTAWNKINKELTKCKEKGIDPIEAFETMVAGGWQSLKVDYFEKQQHTPNPRYPTSEERKANELKIREREIRSAEEKRKEIEASKKLKTIVGVAKQKISMHERLAQVEKERQSMGMTKEEYHNHITTRVNSG